MLSASEQLAIVNVHGIGGAVNDAAFFDGSRFGDGMVAVVSGQFSGSIHRCSTAM
jgi:hypothetical protein